MFFNKALTLVSALALGALTASAAPVHAPAVAVGAAAAAGAHVALPDHVHHHGKRELVGIAEIFLDLQVNIAEPCMDLHYLTSANATTEIVTGLAVEISGHLTDAVASLKLLVGADLAIILAPVTGTVLLTVAEVAAIISGVLHIILEGLACMLQLDIAVLLSLFSPCGSLIGTLLTVVFTLVGGLEMILVPLLADVLGVVSAFGFASLLAILHL